MKRTIFFAIFLSAILFSSISYSQNINKPNISGPMGLSVNSFSGNLYYSRTDLFIPGRGLSIDLTFSYNTATTAIDLGYGSGWSMTYSMIYQRDDNKVIIRRGDGRKDVFTFNGSGYVAPCWNI